MLMWGGKGVGNLFRFSEAGRDAPSGGQAMISRAEAAPPRGAHRGFAEQESRN
jgi:hypothetical protein